MKHIYKTSIILAIGLLLLSFGANKVIGQTVTLTPNPNQSEYCEGSSIEFEAAVTPPGTYTYTWTIGSGAPTIGTETYSYTVPVASIVSETIIVEINSGTVTDTDTFTVNIDPLPTASAGGSATICQNSSYTLTSGQATASNGTIFWTENGAGSITSGATTLTPTYTAAAGDAGNTVILTMTVTSNNTCGAATETVVFNVNVDETQIITLNTGNNIQSVCNNTTIDNITYSLSGGASNVTLSGSLPPGVNGVLAGTTYTISGTPVTAGIYTYTLTTTGNSCTGASATGTITVKALPAVSLSPSIETICEETPVSITMTIESGANWAWFDSYPGPEKTRIFPSLPIGSNDIYVTAYKNGCQNIAHSYITVVGNVTATVSISSSDPDNIVCDGTEVTYTASPVNGGASPVYEWFVNDVSQTGETSALFAFTPSNGDDIRVEMESSLCNNGIAISNTISMTVNAIVAPSVSISPSATNVCAGTEVTYTAIPQNGGTSPSYQWKVNGGNVGLNNNTYSYFPVNGDQITVVMTSNRDCITTPTATSVAITMIVNPILTASVTITVSDPDLEVCENTQVTFTANPVNGGNAPSYQWKVNSINVGSNSSAYSYIPSDNDLITVVMTSNAICVTGSPATSPAVQMTVNDQLIVGVGLQVSENNICEGDNVTFTATPYNGGASPIYQWKVNGVNSGAPTTSNTFVFTPSNGQQISVMMTSNETCILNTTATSDPITMVVNPNEVPTAVIFATNTEICEGEAVAFSALITNGGSTPFYQWKVNGINAGTNNPIFTYTPEDGDIVTVLMTSSLNCVTIETVEAQPIEMTVNPLLPVSVIVNASENNVCAGEAVTFSAIPTNGGVTPVYQWKINGSNVGINTNTYTYAPANTDQVHVVMTSSEQCITGNPATATAVVMNVLPAPSVNLTFIQGSTSACVGDLIKMTTVYNAAYTYTWFNGITQVKTGQGSGANLYEFNLNETSTIRIEVTLGGCILEDIKTIVANPLPNINITPDNASICEGQSLTLTLTGISGTTWHWINPDYVLNYTPITIFPESGDHIFSATATNFFGCINTASISVTVLPLPQVAITAQGGLNACTNAPKTYEATQNPNYSYKWFVNDLEIPDTDNYIFTDTLIGTTPTEIKVVATDDLTGCDNADSLMVNPVQPPVLNMVATRLQLCRGDQTYITLSSPSTPPVYFAWGDGLQGNVLTRGFIPTQDTSIWAEAINSTGCITRKTVNILVRDTLAFTIASSIGNDPVCAGTDVTFTGPTGLNYTYQWFLNGVAQGGATSRTFIKSFTQNTLVRLVVTDTVVGCSGSAIKNIIVKNAPIVDLGPDQEVCQNYMVTLEGPVGTGYTFKWFRNTETTPISLQRVLNFLVPAGVTTLSLEASSVEGCTTSDAIQITSKAVPGITLATNNSEICLEDNVTLTATTTSANSVLWFDGLTTFGPHLRNIVPNIGDSTFIYWAQAVNSIGCTSRDSITVLVNNPPIVTIQAVGGSNSVCVNSSITIQGPQQTGYSYQWYIDGLPFGTNSYQISFVVTENVDITLKVTDGNTCSATSAPLTIQAIDLPGIEILQSETDICLGESVQLTINQQNISYYIWADGLGGNQPVRSFTPANVGVFKFWASGVHAVTGCISTDTVSVNVHPIPVALINPPAQTTVCRGQNVVLTTAVLPNHQYKWSINGDSVAAGASYTFAALQTRTVVLTVKNQFGCVKTDEIVITVEDAPEVNLGGNRQICTNYLLELAGPNVTGYTYKWFVNNVQIANTTYQYAFIVTQPVTVRLEATVGNCTSSDQITVTPLEVPGINVTANNSEICLGETVILQVSTTFANSFIWWDGLGGNLTTRSVVPLQADTTVAYWAEAINGIGCRSRDTVLVHVNPLPEVPLTVVGGSNVICFNGTATVEGPQLEGYNYEWFINDSIVGTDFYQHSFVVTSDVVVKLRVTDANGCLNTNQIAVLVLNLPGIILSPDTLEICLDESFTLTINNQFVNSYSWFDGLAGNLLSRTFTANTPGSFIYWAEGVNNFGCVSRDTAFITVHPLPNLVIQLPAGGNTICQNEPMVLQASPTSGFNYEWYVDGVLADTNALFIFIAESDVEVTLIGTDINGCQASDVVAINVLDAPEVDLGGNQEICIGYMQTFFGPTDGVFNYAWYVNNVFVSTDSAYSIIVNENIMLKLEVVSETGCYAFDEITITSLASPAINLTPDSIAFCLGETATISLATDGTSYIWWDGLGTNVSTRSFTPLIGDSTYIYWAQAVNSIGCTARDTTFVTVFNHPIIDINIQGLANTFCFGTEATVVGPVVEGYDYQWFVNNLPTGDNIDRLVFTVTGNSMVKLEVTDTNGCFGTDSVAVFMHTAPGVLLSPDSLDICIGESFTLTINPQNVLSYAWWDGLAGNQTSRTITPVIADTTFIYWAEGINSIGCISRDTAYISVHSLPEISILTPIGTAICQGDTMVLQTPLVESYTYEWIVNDFIVSTESELAFVAESNVTVLLSITNEFGCVSTETIDIEVWVRPSIDLGEDVFACLDEALVFEGPLGEGFTYAWYLNGAATGIVSSQFTYLVADTVSIRLDMNTQNGCFASDTILVTSLLTPKVVITPSAEELCMGESLTLTASTTDAVSFEWWDGFTSLTRIVTPDNIGINSYWAEVVSVDNCSFRDSVSVVVHPTPQILLLIQEGASTICEGESVTFSLQETSGLAIDHVVWNQSITVPMGTDIIKYYTYTFEESMWFYGEMVTLNGCSLMDSIFIEVQPLPEMTISNDTIVCAGQPVVLQATGGSSCIWMDETGIIGAGYTLQLVATTSKTYYATVYDNSNLSCSSIDSVLVSVEPLPVLILEASQQNVCGGTPIVLTAQGASAYVWSTGQTGPTITVLPMQTTIYTVTGLNEQGCIAEKSIVVNIIPSPEVTLTGLNPLYCMNDDPSVLTGTPVGGIFTGAGVVGGVFHPDLAGAGAHQVIYSYINQFGCVGSDTLQTTIVVISDVINLGDDAAICPHEEIIFDAGPGYQKYYWSTGDTTRTTIISGNSYFPGTTRTITVIGTIQECSVMGTVNLTIRNDCYISIDELEKNQSMTLIPNPSRGEFVIQHLGGEGRLIVNIFDSRGVSVHSGTFENCNENGNSQCRFNLSYLPKGIYMVTVINEGRQFVRKMVIM